MSDAHNEHEAFIKTPKQLILVVLAAFIVPIAIIVLLVTYVGNDAKVGVGGNEGSDAVAARIAPVAKLEVKDPAAPRVFKTGEQVYKELCSACHAAGAAGAPKFGNAGEWSARLGKGYDGLLKSLLAGKGAMPARAGSSPDDYSEYELGRAVVYMANAGGAKFNEPAAPAAAAAPAGGAKVTADTGKQIFTQVCAACHATGAAGAPKFGDKAAWAPRIKDVKALYASAAKGKGAMPPKGGFTGSDEEFKAAVDYIVAAAK